MNQIGYDLGAFCALDFFCLEFFSDKARWLNLGGGAGITCGEDDGLARYKKGWSTEARTAFLCGQIFNPEVYEEILREKRIRVTDYFPAYRRGEFGTSR